MKTSWLLAVFLDLLQSLVLICFGNASLWVGARGATLLAYKLDGECGLPVIPTIYEGGLGGVLAFHQGVYKRQLV